MYVGGHIIQHHTPQRADNRVVPTLFNFKCCDWLAIYIYSVSVPCAVCEKVVDSICILYIFARWCKFQFQCNNCMELLTTFNIRSKQQKKQDTSAFWWHFPLIFHKMHWRDTQQHKNFLSLIRNHKCAIKVHYFTDTLACLELWRLRFFF